MTTRLVGLRWVVVSACIGSFGLAQSTYVVPTGADLSAYIQMAAPGDTLILGASHPNFTLAKGLKLLGNNTQILPTLGNGETTVTVPAGQRATLSGLAIAYAFSPPFSLTSGALDLAGDILVEDCTASSFYVPVRVRSGNVLLRNCELSGGRGSAGMAVYGGFCSLVGSRVRGSNGVQEYMGPSYNGGPGILVHGGTLWLSSAEVKGGNLGTIYGQPSLAGQPAMLVYGSSTVQVCQSTLTGGDGSWFLGAPIYAHPAILASSGTVLETGNTLAFGAGPTQGAPVVGNVQSEPLLVGLRSSGVLARGATFQLQATAGAAQMPLVLAASLAASAGMHPLVAQPVLGGGSGLVVQLVAPAPAPGAVVTATTTVPNAAALQGVCVAWQAFQWTGGMVQASAIVGGMVR